MVLEQAIRERSYTIWKREGEPEGRAVEHWLRAQMELETEARAVVLSLVGQRDFAMARLVVSDPPQRMLSRRIEQPAPIAAMR